jgi:hypothetical protein
MAIALILGGAMATSVAFAKGKPPTGESGVNNLSFPLILSDNVAPALAGDGIWKWAPITEPSTQCIGEAGVTPGTAVDPSILCYYGRKVDVNEETGAIVFIGEPKVWWLQKRPANFWKALSVFHTTLDTPLVVSAVDIGDLLESSPSIAARQIRVEFNLLQSVDPTVDTELGPYVADWTGYTGGLPLPAPCTVPDVAGESIGCFAAFGMSGAVPGTEQSGNEMQGNDFGPGPTPALNTGTLTLLDPTNVRLANDGAIPIHALVYSRCARLLIQQITGIPSWNPATGTWNGGNAPVVNTAAYAATNPWTVETTSGGSIVYGYNWNAQTATVGTYRLTFVLDGNDTNGPQCSTQLGTMFDDTATQLVNAGEVGRSEGIIPKGDTALNGGDEGGIAWLDLTLTSKGGGGGRGGQGPRPR